MKTRLNKSPLSLLPSVHQVLERPEMQAAADKYHRDFVLWTVQKEIDELRRELRSQKAARFDSRTAILDEIVKRSLAGIEGKLKPSLRKVVNATGVILHTGLGRAPLSDSVRENVMRVTEGYCSLEIDLESGKRGDRTRHIEEILCFLTAAEAACVVNNNAAAVLLSLNTLCFGKEAIISRGQLIEIGGSFRMPDVMAKSGVIMVEVGTTNKTHFNDYVDAITENTGLLCFVHPSNYRIKGFTAEVGLGELVRIGREHGIPVFEDLGGGILVDLREYGLPYEPVVRESVECGADVVTFSGDKVFGGPQAGLIVGKRKYIEQIKRNPLMRALRCDKMTYAALEATLKLFLDKTRLPERNRVLTLMTLDQTALSQRASELARRITAGEPKELEVEVVDAVSQIGSGALPLEELPSKAVRLRSPRLGVEGLARLFRLHTPPVLGYIRNDWLYFDVRTFLPGEEDLLVSAVGDVCDQLRGGESAKS
ncbi:MAG: L-seryl-tRNA(Sec) selenium transferase [Calditrichaeota bacterium]|nr:MAG: L-seryl-tRNA(Sec) selenium transferase [Calditrichota bacterium]